MMVIIHIITVADREIALAQAAHAHPFVEMQRAVTAVDVEFHHAGSGMHAADVFHGAAEQKLPGAEALKTGQDVDFLEVEQIPLPCRSTETPHGSPSDEAMNQTCPARNCPCRLGVHPLHHVIQLRGREDLAAGGGEDLPGQTADQRAIGFGGPAD